MHLLNSIPFQIGFYLILIISGFTAFRWMLASLSKVRTEEVSLFFGTMKTWTINSLKLKIGYFPFGGYVRFHGMMVDDQTIAEPTPNEPFAYRKKSVLTKVVILHLPTILILIAGVVLLKRTLSIALMEALFTYVKTSFFIMSLEEGNVLWKALGENSGAISGFLLFIFGCVNIVLGWQVIFKTFNKLASFFGILSLVYMPLFLVVPVKLLWNYFSMEVGFYLLAGILAGSVVSVVVFLILAKILPNFGAYIPETSQKNEVQPESSSTNANGLAQPDLDDITIFNVDHSNLNDDAYEWEQAWIAAGYLDRDIPYVLHKKGEYYYVYEETQEDGKVYYSAERVYYIPGEYYSEDGIAAIPVDYEWLVYEGFRMIPIDEFKRIQKEGRKLVPKRK